MINSTTLAITVHFDLLFMNLSNHLKFPEIMLLVAKEMVDIFNFKNKLHSLQIKKWGNQFSLSFIDQNAERNNHSQQWYIYFTFSLDIQQIIQI